jgi:hypothetical protein
MQVHLVQNFFWMNDLWSVVLHQLLQPTEKTNHQQPMAAINLICSNRTLWLASGSVWKTIAKLIEHWPSYIAFKKRHRGLSLRSKLITWAAARTGGCSFCHGTSAMHPLHHIGVRLCAPCIRDRMVCLDGFQYTGRFQWMPDRTGTMRKFALWRDLVKHTGKSKEELLFK